MDEAIERGPYGWRNWRAALAARPAGGVVEFACFTDAHLTGGNFKLGPYEVINVVASFGPTGNAEMGLVLRVSDHLPNEERDIDWSRTDTAHYYGGGVGEELASLLALALGVRCRTAGPIREFEDAADRYGRIWADGTVKPFLAPPRGNPLNRNAGAMLPGISRQITLEDAISLLNIYPQLAVDDAVALLRAARGYEEALWVADGDAQLAWFRLVAGVEAAALQWSGVRAEDPRAAFAAAWPELLEKIDRHPGADEVIRDLAPLVRSFKRFRDFLLEHMPDAPERRPTYGELDWAQMSQHLRAIYTARSKALHEGTPLPVPMIEPPRALGEDGVPAETVGAPLSSRGAVWLPQDAPMHLHVFAYIAGEALRAWWRALTTDVTGA